MFGYICAAINFTTNTIIGIAMIAVAALIIVLMSVCLRGPSDSDEAPSAVEETPVAKEEPTVEESSKEETYKQEEVVSKQCEESAPTVEEPAEEEVAADERVEEVAEEQSQAEVSTEEVVEEATVEEITADEAVEEVEEQTTFIEEPQQVEEPAAEEIEEVSATETAVEEDVKEEPVAETAEESTQEEMPEELTYEESNTSPSRLRARRIGVYGDVEGSIILGDSSVATVTPATVAKKEVEAPVVAEENAFPKITAKKRSFAEKVRDLPDESKENYNMLKNQLMSYEGIKNRTTKSNDIFRHKREYVAKISVLGKTVKLHLALNPDDYLVTKYHHKDLSAKKKYAKVPFMLKIKSQRSKKFAVELIGDAMRRAGLEKGAESNADYVKELVATIPAE